jgi:hypothetical protein
MLLMQNRARPMQLVSMLSLFKHERMMDTKSALSAREKKTMDGCILTCQVSVLRLQTGTEPCTNSGGK